MGQLRDRMQADLKIGGYSPSTQKVYLLYARQFAAHFMRSPSEMGADEIRQFLLHLLEERKISRETLRQVRSALRFLYRVTLNRPIDVEWLPPPRRQKRLPVVLSGSEVQALLDAVQAPNHRAILMSLFAGGLRISVACGLRAVDIDSKRMVIHIRNAKGTADHYTFLADRLLHNLRDYWLRTRPSSGWMFPGRRASRHLSTESVRKVFRKTVAAAGIKKTVTPHVLRHSFATHLLECGTDVTVVQAVLGHSSLRATEVYTHVSLEHIARTRSPLDLLGTPAASIFG